MKNTHALLLIGACLVACQPTQNEAPDPAWEAFERNSEVVKQDIENWINETPDYSNYAEDMYFYPTNFSLEPDSVSLTESMENDKAALAAYDFAIADELVLLPGVNAETKQMDGSVRFYAIWELTKTATDSTEAKSAKIAVYHSYDFNAEGKITNQVTYGDFTGILRYLNGADDKDDSSMEEDM